MSCDSYSVPRMMNVGRLSWLYEQSIGTIALWLVTWMPGFLGYGMRYAYYRKRLKHLGLGVAFSPGVEIQNPEYVSISNNTWIDRNVLIIAGPIREGNRSVQRKKNKDYLGEEGYLEIGKGCHIAPNCVIQAHAGVFIGDFTGLAAGVRLYSVTHHYRRYKSNGKKPLMFTPMAPDGNQSLIVHPVVIQDMCAIGLNVVILPGVTVGRNSWVTVQSCAVRRVPPNTIASGCPAAYKKKKGF